MVWRRRSALTPDITAADARGASGPDLDRRDRGHEVGSSARAPGHPPVDPRKLRRRKRLDQRNLDVDHCFPWVAWPCGDLWNLLPSSRQVNQRLKRDRLIDVATLAQREGLHRRLVVEGLGTGGVSAPGQGPLRARGGGDLSIDNPDDEARLLDEIYAGLEWQRMRLQNDQRLEEWSGLAAAGS